MAAFLRSLWRRSPLGRALERRQRRDEHRRQLERTRHAVEHAHHEAQIWLRSCSPQLRAAATQRLSTLDAAWQRACAPDDVERTIELGRLEGAFRDTGAMMLALWSLERAAENPRRWVQELLAAGDDAEPGRTPARPRRRSAAAQVPDPAKLARLAEQLASLDRRYQELVVALPTAEPGDVVAQVVEPLERGFRQLANESYRPWSTRFPERAKAAREEAFEQMQRILRRDKPRAQSSTTAAQARPDGTVELGEPDLAPREEE